MKEYITPSRKSHGFYCMISCEKQILQLLAVLVVCHGLAAGQIISHYSLVQRRMSWFKAREFCKKHYVDLAVMSTEEQYFTLFNATAAEKFSFWLGLQRQSIFSGWRWVNGEELSYEHWYRRNYEGRCASLEAMLRKDKKLLARYCEELHMFVCQGPVSPQPVTVDSVGSNHVTLSWNVSAFMHTTPHSYNVTTCTNTCHTLLYPYADGSAFMNISISNLTSATDHFITIVAFVVRPDNITGGKIILQSKPAALHIKTANCDGQYNVNVIVILKQLKLVSLAPLVWFLYLILKNDNFKKSDHDTSQVQLSTEDSVIDLIPGKTRGIG